MFILSFKGLPWTKLMCSFTGSFPPINVGYAPSSRSSRIHQTIEQNQDQAPPKLPACCVRFISCSPEARTIRNVFVSSPRASSTKGSSTSTNDLTHACAYCPSTNSQEASTRSGARRQSSSTPATRSKQSRHAPARCSDRLFHQRDAFALSACSLRTPSTCSSQPRAGCSYS